MTKALPKSVAKPVSQAGPRAVLAIVGTLSVAAVPCSPAAADQSKGPATALEHPGGTAGATSMASRAPAAGPAERQVRTVELTTSLRMLPSAGRRSRLAVTVAPAGGVARDVWLALATREATWEHRAMGCATNRAATLLACYLGDLARPRTVLVGRHGPAEEPVSAKAVAANGARPAAVSLPPAGTRTAPSQTGVRTPADPAPAGKGTPADPPTGSAASGSAASGSAASGNAEAGDTAADDMAPSHAGHPANADTGGTASATGPNGAPSPTADPSGGSAPAANPSRVPGRAGHGAPASPGGSKAVTAPARPGRTVPSASSSSGVPHILPAPNDPRRAHGRTTDARARPSVRPSARPSDPPPLQPLPAGAPGAPGAAGVVPPGVPPASPGPTQAGAPALLPKIAPDPSPSMPAPEGISEFTTLSPARALRAGRYSWASVIGATVVAEAALVWLAIGIWLRRRRLRPIVPRRRIDKSRPPRRDADTEQAIP